MRISSRLLIVFVYRQRILCRNYRGERVECFEKKGLNLPVAKEASWEKMEDVVFRIEHRFIVHAKKRYSGQDTTQMASVVETIFRKFKSRVPITCELQTESDTATCCASQAVIPFARPHAWTTCCSLARWLTLKHRQEIDALIRIFYFWIFFYN